MSRLILPILAPAGMLVSLYMVFLNTPTERTMGVVQKIFYFHVPSAWVAFLAFFIVFISSILYLTRTEKKWDDLAASAAAVGTVFCSYVLISGPVWAKPVWGVWWTWDLRLTLTLVLWLIFVGYLMLRQYITAPEKKATYCAVLGIFGFIDVPLVYLSIRFWRTQHPSPVFAGGADSGLDPAMRTTFIVCMLSFTILFAWLLQLRFRLEALREEKDELLDRLETTA
jgi:heme exporter protein C